MEKLIKINIFLLLCTQLSGFLILFNHTNVSDVGSGVEVNASHFFCVCL